MCYERYLHRRERESRELWQDFESTRPLVDTDPPDEETEVAEARERSASPEG